MVLPVVRLEGRITGVHMFHAFDCSGDTSSEPFAPNSIVEDGVPLLNATAG
ncbi:hypothetical protein FHT80_006171 [Rhizobium sp. BK226]|jgi:hypothetical protein|nr:hypothetical protein [Rhizobium sp. BK226]